MADIPGGPDGPLEDIAYLARSENRVTVLETMTSTVTAPGQPTPGYSRRRLIELTGVSRTTLGRILTEFQDRGWARRNDDGEYVVTPIGEHVAAEFDPLVRSMECLQDLGEGASIIPRSELADRPEDSPPISIRHFSDANVRKPDSYDPTFFGRYFANIIEGTHLMYSMVYVATPQNMLTAIERELQVGELSVESVFSSSVTDHILTNPDVGPRREHIEQFDVAMYRHRGHIPCNLFVVDETVFIENSQVDSIPDGTVIETQNPAVRKWALAVIEQYKEESEPIGPADFS